MISERENHHQNAHSTQFERDICTKRSIFTDEEWLLLSQTLKLCSRELQIVKGIFADQTERQIALQLGISHHTIHTYVIRLYRKLDVSSRCELLLEVFAEYLAQQFSRNRIV